MSLLLLLEFGGCKPGVEDGVCHVDARPEVHVHLVSHCGNGSVDEERGVGGASDAPDDVGALSIVPGCCFFNYARGTGGIGDVGTDVVEAFG